MKYFAGLDVSLEETAICVVDEDGRIIKEIRADSTPEALLAALSALELRFERIGLEACSPTAWLHQGLRSAGLPAICIESRHAKAAMGDAEQDRPQRRTRPGAKSCGLAGSAPFM